MKEHLKLLYIEDDEVDRRAFLRMAKEEGRHYEIAIAKNLTEARKHLRTTVFDIILSDYHLPDGHGTDLFSEVRDTPFVLLTGTMEEGMALRTLERGADDYLPKIADQSHLKALPFTIEKTLHRKRIRERERRLTRQLLDSEERFRLLVNSVKDYALCMLDSEGFVTTWNSGAEHIKGWKADEIVGRHFSIFFLPEDVHAGEPERELEIAARDGLFHREAERLRKDGSSFWADVTVTPVLDDRRDLIGFGKVTRDISERKQNEEAIRDSADKLARSNHDLEQFAYVVSHDLQEPLRMVASYTQLLAERYRGKLDDDADKYIAYAVDGAARLQAMIADVLSFSRAGREDGGTAVDAALALQQALSNLQPAIQESGALVEAGELPTVWATPAPLRQVFQNLIANAIKFRSHGMAPLISVKAERSAGFWIFVIRDNGIGIAPEHLQSVFGVFRRLHTQKEYAGNGIGLATCKKVVERYGGKIWAESQPGVGSTFKFTLRGEQAEYKPRAEQRAAAV